MAPTLNFKHSLHVPGTEDGAIVKHAVYVLLYDSYAAQTSDAGPGKNRHMPRASRRREAYISVCRALKNV